jgi:hypothetical protein
MYLKLKMLFQTLFYKVNIFTNIDDKNIFIFTAQINKMPAMTTELCMYLLFSFMYHLESLSEIQNM